MRSLALLLLAAVTLAYAAVYLLTAPSLSEQNPALSTFTVLSTR